MSGAKSLPEALASVIRAKRVRLGVSQEAFADQLGFHRAFYGRIENGQNMTLLTLERVAAGFGVPAWELIREAESGSPVGAPRPRRGLATRH